MSLLGQFFETLPTLFFSRNIEIMMKQALTNSREEEIILYDMTSMVEMQPQIADGYVALLTPGNALPKGASKKSRDSPYMLPFLALTDGNVVDACFGMTAYSRDRDHKCAAFARRAKVLISEAAEASPAVEKLAVDTYRQGFTIVIETQRKINKKNVLVRCFVAGKIRRRGKESLRQAFRRLEEAVQAST